MPDNTITPKIFQRLLLKWFDSHGRKNLPWQENKTPYRVWLSEVMLQQTQVKTVIPYYERFLDHFPTIESLADADEDTVFHSWSGLGYYRRARYLHQAAKDIVSRHSGQFPDQAADLENLPGIGRSTASAILAIAFKKRATILDGNVKRVLTRLFAITEWMDDKKLWPTAEKYTPTQRCDDYTQAIMDLGATICTRSSPLCNLCPVQPHCAAHKLGIEKNLPVRKMKKSIPTRQTALFILKKNDTVLLEKRPPTGIWAGLWSLPEFSETISTNAIRVVCRQRFGATVVKQTVGEIFRHTFSHFHLDITPILIEISKVQPKLMDDQQQIWYNLLESTRIGLPAPIKKLLDKIEISHDPLR